MKTPFLILLTLMLPLTLFAQEVSESQVDDKIVLVVNFNSESKDYTNMKVMFTTKTSASFVSKIRKFGEKVISWSEKAIKNDVSNFRKPIPGTVDYDHLEFEFDGSVNTSEGYFMVPSFDVDAEGKCHLLLRGYYEGANITTARNSRVAGDKQRYQQKCAFNFFVRIPYNEINAWVDKVEKMSNQVAADQQKLKETKKLFK